MARPLTKQGKQIEEYVELAYKHAIEDGLTEQAKAYGKVLEFLEALTHDRVHA